MENTTKIIIRRICSGIIEILLVGIPTYVVCYFREGVVLSFISLFWYTLLILILASAFIPYDGTVGDYWMKLRITDVDGMRPSRIKLLLRNFSWWLLIGIVIIDQNNKFDLFVGSIILVCMYIPILSNKNKYHEHMTGVDLFLKIKYVSRD